MNHLVEIDNWYLKCLKCELRILLLGITLQKRVRGNYARYTYSGKHATDTSIHNKRYSRCQISDEEYRMRELLK